MKRFFLMVFFLVFFLAVAGAADTNLSWEPSPGATGYKLAMSADLGATWSAPLDCKMANPCLFTGVPEDKLILFKVSAYNTSMTVWKEWAFAAVDYRKKPLQETSGPGVK
jgi:hypothetical protein